MRRWWELVDGLEKRGGTAQSFARLVFAATKSAKATVVNRSVSVVRWSSSQQAWLHQWSSGRVMDRRRWTTPEQWATGGYYDMDDLLWRKYRPKQGDVVIDIGAGHGGETFFLATMVGESGRVLSVEAAPAPFQRLKDLVQIRLFTVEGVAGV